MKRAIWSALVFCLWACPCTAQFMGAEFRVQGQPGTYRARVSSDWIKPGLSQQLDIAVSVGDSREWVISDRTELVGLKCPEEIKPVTLRTNNGTVPAVLVRGGGDSRNFVYVVQVVTPRGVPDSELRTLLDEYHEGDKPRVQFDQEGNLEAMTLQYAAMHRLPDSMFRGHIIVVRTLKWDTKKHKFVAGPWYADGGAEKALSLVEAVTFVGSYRLGVSHAYNELTKTSTYTFKPTGILMDKLPENLRSASMVEVAVGPDGTVKSKSISPKR